MQEVPAGLFRGDERFGPDGEPEEITEWDADEFGEPEDPDDYEYLQSLYTA
jgi:hypothetical protein